MLKSKLRIMAMATLLSVGISSSPVFATGEAPNQTGDILVYGTDLTDKEEADLGEYFGAPEGTKTIYTTNDMIVEQLGLDPNDPSNYQGGCYSSAYVKMTEPSMNGGENGEGLNIEVNNLTEVTDTMLMNALITSGVYNANVKVSSPFPVTGTSALAGILAGVENVRGEEISLENKVTAQQEIETTMEVSEEIGAEEASAIINEVKTEVLKEQPKDEADIQNIVEDVVNNYDVNISDNSINNITNLMTEVNNLDINYDEIKETLSSTTEAIQAKLSDLGRTLEENGFWDKLGNAFKGMWEAITSFFSSVEDTVNTEETAAPVTEERPADDTTLSPVEVAEPTEENTTTEEVQSENVEPVEESTEETGVILEGEVDSQETIYPSEQEDAQ